MQTQDRDRQTACREAGPDSYNEQIADSRQGKRGGENPHQGLVRKGALILPLSVTPTHFRDSDYYKCTSTDTNRTESLRQG